MTGCNPPLPAGISPPGRAFRRGLRALGLSLCLLLVVTPAMAAKLTYQIKGLRGDNKSNVEAYLNALPVYQERQFRPARAKITESVQKALQVYGYYQPKITLSRDKQTPSKVVIEVDPGKPVIISRLDILLEGDAGSDEVYSELLDKLPLKEGDALNHGKYESIKADLGNLGLARGYFDAKISKSQVKVFPDQGTAEIFILFRSGPRYHFGEIHYDATPEALRLIRPLINIKRGDPYLAIRMAEMSQDVSSTKLFKQVDIKPMISQAEGNRVPVQVTLSNRVDHEIETGVGFATDVGPRMSATWEKPWVNRYGHRLNATANVSAPQADLSFDYQIPVGNPLRDYYSLQTGYRYTNNNDTRSDLATFSVHRWTRRPETWDRDVFIRLENESYVQGKDEGNSLLLIPGVSWSRLRVRGGLVPDWGDRQQLTLEFSDPYWGSDISFMRVWGRSKWLRTLGDDHRFLLRAEQGAIIGDSFSLVPPSLRFFTGGDQTVRGYGYETISPRDSDGKLLGGRYVSAASAEYNYRFSDKWLGALFVDGGTATEDYSEAWKIGTGVGVRWVTPIGQVRLDLAVGISEEDKPLRLHFALGPEL
ncbi:MULTISPECIES: autotransporter assembly complex protein TamA [Aeromonas]|uniref:autotransporter assembly complex protein TamA n=1 Tax=Aeromonas TaxID=642 RepID=UPI00223FF51D|nr:MULTISPECIES: autotransporter assembly complex family protein [Aeromonas]HEH9396974.1 outer membrane protein assembly factor [Aeromonas salmonicida]